MTVARRAGKSHRQQIEVSAEAKSHLNVVSVFSAEAVDMPSAEDDYLLKLAKENDCVTVPQHDVADGTSVRCRQMRSQSSLKFKESRIHDT